MVSLRVRKEAGLTAGFTSLSLAPRGGACTAAKHIAHPTTALANALSSVVLWKVID